MAKRGKEPKTRAPKGEPRPTPLLGLTGKQLVDSKGRLRWRLRYTDPITKRRPEHPFAGTYEQAVKALDRHIADASGGLKTDRASKKTTLYAYADGWAQRYRVRAENEGKARSTWVEHTGNVERYIRPTLETLRWEKRALNTFTADDIDTLVAAAQPVRKAQLSAGMRASIRKTVRMMLAQAATDGLITKSPLHGQRATWRPAPVEGYVPSSVEVERVAARMAAARPGRRGGVGKPQPWLGAMLLFLLWSGLRVSEALALRLSDVDLDDAEIRVTKAATVAGGRRTESHRTKTRTAQRSLPLMPQGREAADTLTKHARKVGSDYLFAHVKKGSNPPHAIAYGVLRRHFAAALAAAYDAGEVASGDWTLHSVRHTTATTLLESGIPPHTVSAWLGHSTPAITIAVYGSRVERDRSNEAREAGRLVSQMLDPTRPRF